MPPGFYPTAIAIQCLWAIWILIWFLSAFSAKRSIYRQPMGQRLFYLLIGLCAGALIRYSPFRNTWLLPYGPANEITGIALCFLGMAFTVWARIHLGRNWSGFVTLKEDHQLIQSGPYRLVRHPIYTGILLAIFGTLLALTPALGALLAFLLFIFSFTIKLRQEEKLMLQQFPDQYPAYKSRVKALIPFLL